MSDYKREEEVQQIETSGKRKRGCLSHLKKFWWLYLIVLALLALLVILLIIFVAVKAIAQSKLNHARLTVEGIEVTNTTATSMNMAINSTIYSDGSIKAKIDDFDGDMYLEDEPSHKPFATIHFPTTHNVKVQTVNVSQLVQITDVDALTTFNTWLLTKETLRVTIKGKTKVHVNGIAHGYGATFKKTVTLDGLQNFTGITVANSSITATNFSDGNNFHTTAYIPNRSIVGFEIGNATFANFLNGVNVGNSGLNNAMIRPGNNSYPFWAKISQIPVITAVTTEPYCAGGIVPFGLTGESVVNNGQNLTYFATALAAANTSVDIDLSTPLHAIGLNVSCSS